MARIAWSVFPLLLAFASGSFLTFTLMLHSMQKSESQKLAEVFASEGRPVETGAWRERQREIIRPQENMKNDRPLNRIDRKLNASIKQSKQSTLFRQDPTKPYPSDPVQILCWVMTSPETLQSRASNVRETWGPRCDVTLYMSSESDAAFPAVGLDVAEGRKALWNKTKAAFRYIHEHHLNDANWFMKADDDTYVIVENLRNFLRDKNSSEPVYYGHHFKKYIKRGYMSGGAGYVVSREALERLTHQLREQENCGAPSILTQAEDVSLGLCMMKAGVTAGDSRDDKNRSRFLPFDVETFYSNNLPDWYFHFAKYPVKQDRDCCSDSLISIHYVNDRVSMLLLDYYIHGLQPWPVG